MKDIEEKKDVTETISCEAPIDIVSSELVIREDNVDISKDLDCKEVSISSIIGNAIDVYTGGDAEGTCCRDDKVCCKEAVKKI